MGFLRADKAQALPTPLQHGMRPGRGGEPFSRPCRAEGTACQGARRACGERRQPCCPLGTAGRRWALIYPGRGSSPALGLSGSLSFTPACLSDHADASQGRAPHNDKDTVLPAQAPPSRFSAAH